MNRVRWLRDHVVWFWRVTRLIPGVLRGEHTHVSLDNELKVLAVRYRVNWHRFDE